MRTWVHLAEGLLNKNISSILFYEVASKLYEEIGLILLIVIMYTYIRPNQGGPVVTGPGF